MNVKQWLFKTSDGKMVVGEKPNAPIIIAAAFYFVSWMINGDIAIILGWIGRIALLYWAYLEIFKGVNNFRRLLGAAVAAAIIVKLVF
jgi:hypothetical protein